MLLEDGGNIRNAEATMMIRDDVDRDCDCGGFGAMGTCKRFHLNDTFWSPMLKQQNEGLDSIRIAAGVVSDAGIQRLHHLNLHTRNLSTNWVGLEAAVLMSWRHTRTRGRFCIYIVYCGQKLLI